MELAYLTTLLDNHEMSRLWLVDPGAGFHTWGILHIVMKRKRNRFSWFLRRVVARSSAAAFICCVSVESFRMWESHESRLQHFTVKNQPVPVNSAVTLSINHKFNRNLIHQLQPFMCTSLPCCGCGCVAWMVVYFYLFKMDSYKSNMLICKILTFRLVFICSPKTNNIHTHI